MFCPQSKKTVAIRASAQLPNNIPIHYFFPLWFLMGLKIHFFTWLRLQSCPVPYFSEGLPWFSSDSYVFLACRSKQEQSNCMHLHTNLCVKLGMVMLFLYLLVGWTNQSRFMVLSVDAPPSGGAYLVTQDGIDVGMHLS